MDGLLAAALHSWSFRAMLGHLSLFPKALWHMNPSILNLADICGALPKSMVPCLVQRGTQRHNTAQTIRPPS